MALTKAILSENLSDMPGLNKREGKEAVIEARRVITFKIGQKLKLRVKEYGTRVVS